MNSWSRPLALVLAAVSGWPLAAQGAEPEVVRLQAGSPLRKELAGGEVHRYEVVLQAGDYVHIVVDQLGIDVAVSLFSPDGRKLLEMDTPTANRGVEHVSWIARLPGAYRVDVASFRKDVPSAAYQIDIPELRASDPKDELRVNAQAAFLEGYPLTFKPLVESRKKGIETLEHSLILWREIGDRYFEAVTLYSLGRARISVNEQARAIEDLTRSLALWRSAGDRASEAATLFALGLAEWSRTRPREALTYYSEAVSIERALGNRLLEAENLSSIGMAQDALGNRREALESYQRALPLARETRNKSGEMRTLNNIGFVHDFLGDKQKALDFYQEALEISLALGAQRSQAVYLANIGRVYGDLGETERALDYLGRALTISRSSGDRWQEGGVLLYTGRIYASEEEYSKALEAYGQALPALRAVEDRRKEAGTLNSMAEARVALAQPSEALVLLEEALSLSRKAGDPYLEARILTTTGRAHEVRDETDSALDRFRQALVLARTVGDRPGEARILYEMARAEERRGDLTAALLNSERALGVVELLRAEVSSHPLRASYLGTLWRYYDLDIELLMRSHAREPDKGFDALALHASERAQARDLLDLLMEAHVEIREGGDARLLEKERTLRERIVARVQRQLWFLGGKALPPEEMSAAAAETEAFRAELQRVEAKIRETSPHYAALTQPVPLTAAEIRSALVDDRTVLIRYRLGEKRSFLWVVSKKSLATHELPSRRQVEDAARRVYELLTARNLRPKAETAEARKHRVDQADADYPAAAASLSRMLLSPAAADLAGKRLLVVPDGALQYVPFAALPEPTNSGESGLEPLAARHEIAILPSASVLSVLRKEVAGRPMAAKTLAVLADPVFDRDDERVASAAGSLTRQGLAPEAVLARGAGDNQPDLLRLAADAGVPDGSETRIARLPFTRREARAILDQVPVHSRKEALDFDASRATAMSPELSGYRFVHFATHGFLDSSHPELSGLVLSLVDRKGRDQPGFLGAADVFNLKLSAELVVLSGCQTALGKEISGEGLVGLTRAFMYAGAPRVVASLWKVDDVATAELMKRFYAGMLGPKRLRPAAALREAQVEMKKQKRWREAYYWAAFVLEGEWN